MLALPFICGIFITLKLSIGFRWLILAGLVALVIVLICNRNGLVAIASWLLLACFLIAGVAVASVEKRARLGNPLRALYDTRQLTPDDPVEIEGVISIPPEITPDGFYLPLELQNLSYSETTIPVSGTVGLWATVKDQGTAASYDALALRYGARVRVMTKLDRSPRFRNTGVPTREEELDRQGIVATGTIKSPLLVERLGDERVILPLAWVYEWRQWLIAHIHSSFSRETAGLLSAALLGNRHGLSKATAERFREGGTFHLLVISGFHITFLGMVLSGFATLLTRRREIQFILATLGLWGFVMAVGAGPSVVRAALVFSIIFLGRVLHRNASSLNGLGGAAIAILCWSPLALFDLSFQLTFVSVVAILLIATPILDALSEVGRWRPTRATPYPPRCALWFKVLSESLYWSESEFRAEMRSSSYSYNLFKTPIAQPLERLKLQRPLRYCLVALIVSVSVELGLLPLQAIYFHRVSESSLVLNIYSGFVMAALTVSAVAATTAGALSPHLANILVRLTEVLSWLLAHLVDPFTSRGLASFRLPSYSGMGAFVYVLYIAVLVVAAKRLSAWRPLGLNDAHTHPGLRLFDLRVTAPFMVLMVIVVAAHPFASSKADLRLHVDFLDVGQGDAVLVTMPDGTSLLVDGGGRPATHNANAGDSVEDETFEPDVQSVGEGVVSQYLWSRGIDHVDYLLATHADADHIDGLGDVAKNFHVRSAFVARRPMDDPEFVRFAEIAKAMGIPLQIVTKGAVLEFGRVRAEVLAPEASENPNAPSANNDSLVLRIKYGDRVFLLTGDMEKESESQVLTSNERLDCDVVKVAHHGSNTSSTPEFVAGTHARFAVISVGLRSPFGHPVPAIVDRWKASGAQTLTTGENGTISFTTDGSDLQLSTYVGAPDFR